MSEYLGYVVGVVGFLIGISGWLRTQKKDSGEIAAQNATFMVRLDGISTGINEIKTDVRGMRDEQGRIRERLGIAEKSIDRAHERISHLEKTTHTS